MVGQHLIEAAADRGIVCRGTSRTQPLKLPKGSTWTAWNLAEWRTPEELDELFADVDAVVHAGAWVVPESVADTRLLLDINVRSCSCIGRWARGREIPLVFISGATVYSDPSRTGIKEEDPKTSGPSLGGFYGLTKYLGELVLGYELAQGLRLTVLRPSSIFGSGLAAGRLVRTLLEHAIAGQKISLKQPVDDRFNLIHATDVATATLDALEHQACGTFNIAGETVSLETIAKTCVKVAGRGSVSIEGPASRLPNSRFDLDCSAAEQAFGYRSTISLDQGLSRMFDDIMRSGGVTP